MVCEHLDTSLAGQDVDGPSDHVRGSHIIIDANVGGGIHLEARQTPNSLGGRTINILTSKAGVEMLTYHADTSKIDTAAMLKVGLKGELTLNPESILYRTVVSQYQFLTPFRTRSSDLEFMVDRVNKNAFLNKFHVKAKWIRTVPMYSIWRSPLTTNR